MPTVLNRASHLPGVMVLTALSTLPVTLAPSAMAREQAIEGTGAGQATKAKPEGTVQDFVNQLTSWGAAWNTAGPVEYSYLEKHPMPSVYKFSPFTAEQRAAMERMITGIADVANITFVKVPHQGEEPSKNNRRISIYNVDFANLKFWGAGAPFTRNKTIPMGEILAGQFSVNLQRVGFRGPGWAIGDFNAEGLLHEFSHTLGLNHAGGYAQGGLGQGGNQKRPENSQPVVLSYENNATYFQDTTQYTVMSYWPASKSGANYTIDGKTYYASTPLLYDIAALQALYGTNMQTRKGDTIYGFNSTAGRAEFDFRTNPYPVVAIWDAGGTDTIDLSGYAVPSLINLTAGEFSDVGGLTRNVAVACGTTIENAVGGPADDTIIGNEVANVLDGGAGNDTFLYRQPRESAPQAADRILRFAAGDRIDFSAIDADSRTVEKETFSFIGGKSFSGGAGQLRAYRKGSAWIVEGDTNADGTADVVINVETVKGHTLGSGDFVL